MGLAAVVFGNAANAANTAVDRPRGPDGTLLGYADGGEKLSEGDTSRVRTAAGTVIVVRARVSSDGRWTNAPNGSVIPVTEACNLCRSPPITCRVRSSDGRFITLSHDTMPGKRQRLADAAHTLSGKLRRLGRLLVEPLTADPDMELRLSIPEAQTTTTDGDIGWQDRPPAVLECPNCSSEIYQHRPTSTIDCPTCWREFSPEQFPQLALLYLHCPVCGEHMEYGRRHPEQFDVPEWATCHNCRYHWEFEHF